MMRSLYSGVSGLINHQTRMDVIGHNISMSIPSDIKRPGYLSGYYFSNDERRFTPHGRTGEGESQAGGTGMAVALLIKS